MLSLIAVDGYVISIAILSFLMSFSIGANDAANALATSYGSNALRLLYLVILGAIFEFIGAYWCSGHVAGKLVGNVIEDVDTLDNQLVEQMMLGSSISSFVFIMSSSVFGMPISGTHTVVGALIGSGLATVGSSSINWGKLGVIAASWFIAPILSIILCGLFFVAVCSLTLDKANKVFTTRLLWLTVFTGIAFMLICLMFIKLIQESNRSFTGAEWTLLSISPVLGVFITRLILLFLVKPKEITLKQGLLAVFIFWSAEHFEQLLDEKVLQSAYMFQPQRDEVKQPLLREEQESAEQQPTSSGASSSAHAASSQSKPGAAIDEIQQQVVSEVYRYLMLTAAMMVCLGHGSNDVANSISPLLTVFEIDGDSIRLAYMIGSLGIALGLLVLGFKVMETVGKKVVQLDFAKGFTAQFATALSVNCGSIIGLPLSTTHCMVGSLLGLILCERFDVVKRVYLEQQDETDQLESQQPEINLSVNEKDISRPYEQADNYTKADGATSAKDAVQGRVIAKILVWWLATVPVALIASYAITAIIV